MKSELTTKSRRSILTLLTIGLYLIAYNQVNDTVTTIGNECMSSTLRSYSYLQKDISYSFSGDTLKLSGLIEANCCGNHSLIRKATEDTIYLSTLDTGMLCTCNCMFKFNTTFTGCNKKSYILKMHNSYIQKLTRNNSIVSTAKRWNILSGGYATAMVECCLSTAFLQIEVDPRINTIDEKMVLASYDSLNTWDTLGHLKEDNGKVYFRDLKNRQGLIYDFSSNIGDTIVINNYARPVDAEEFEVIVKSIDTLSYLGIKRRRFEIEDIYGNNIDTWIDGIGSTHGLLNSCIMMVGGFRELLCAYDSDIKIYQNEDRDYCYLDTDCTSPVANFDYDILESYPVQVNLKNTEVNCDSITWKGYSAKTGKDTIIGSGESMRIKDITKLQIMMIDCFQMDCMGSDYIEIKQIVENKCGTDSIYKLVPVDYYSSVENQNRINIRCYPNPSHGVLNFSGLTKEELSYDIYNATGKLIQTGIIENSIQVDVPNGLYLINIKNKKGVLQQEKVLIESK